VSVLFYVQYVASIVAGVGVSGVGGLAFWEW